jgi:hypothetical protein
MKAYTEEWEQAVDKIQLDRAYADQKLEIAECNSWGNVMEALALIKKIDARAKELWDLAHAADGEEEWAAIESGMIARNTI